MTGANESSLSPDEKNIAVLHSYSNKPWELYLQPVKAGTAAQQITFKAQSEEFKSYAWRDPEVISFKAADGALVYARVYKPANPHPNKPAVLFVHAPGTCKMHINGGAATSGNLCLTICWLITVIT